MSADPSIIPVILSGGSGSRLWPLSRENYPKQFLPLVNERTMLQDTIQRLDGLEGAGPPIVVCNEEHRFFVHDQLTECECEGFRIILEPFGRNTAPAAALAAILASGLYDDPALLILPADHTVKLIDQFHEAINRARPLCREGKLVTFGAPPYCPETGFGYVRKGPSIETDSAYEIDRFVEKPDEFTAKRFVDSGEYLWNSGIFLFKASDYLNELNEFAPDVVKTCNEAIDNAIDEEAFMIVDPEAFRRCPEDSIDYSVMENTKRGVVVPMDAGWSDMGSWLALWEKCERDADGNASYGDVVAIDVSNSYLHAKDRLLTAVGVKDIMIIETRDAVMAVHKSRVQDVRSIVDQLRIRKSERLNTHRTYRPWGGFEVLDEGEGFKVKKIMVNPGASLSLQMHHHRSERWIVVRGTALVTCGEEKKLLSENEAARIPIGTKHRLENPGIIPLEIIEVQSGPYLGEDDIIRFEDKYNRTQKSKGTGADTDPL